MKKKEAKLKEKLDNLKAEIQRNIIGFDTQIKELTGAKNYAQFLLDKLREKRNGSSSSPTSTVE